MLLTFFREDPSFHFEDIDVDLPICTFTYLLSQISLLHRINLVKSRKVILYNNHQLVKYCMTSENVFGDKGTIYYFQVLSYSLNCSKLSLKLFLQINGGNRCVIHLTLPNCLLPEDQFCPTPCFIAGKIYVRYILLSLASGWSVATSFLFPVLHTKEMQRCSSPEPCGHTDMVLAPSL